jgi:glycosyltransferase involved in cell wall biosynthesis
MKILIIVHRFHTNLFYPVKSLIEYGNQVILIVPKIDIYDKLIEDHSFIEPIRISNRDLSICFIRDLLKQIVPDLIIQRYFHKKWKLFSIIGRFMGIQCVTYDQSPQTYNNLLAQLSRPIQRVIKGQPLRKFTPTLNKGIPGKFKEPFSKFIPFPIEPLVDINIRTYCPDRTIRFLCVGKLGQKRKHHLLLLDALEKINVNCSLTFAGAGPDYALADIEYFNLLEKRCYSSSLKGEIKIIMDLPYQEMIKIYSKHDILVMPAENESHGQCIVEALAAGCPVVTTDDCGAAGYITDGYNGLIFKKNDLNGLIEKLNIFLENPTKISEFGHNAIQQIIEQHSPESFVKDILDLL